MEDDEKINYERKNKDARKCPFEIMDHIAQTMSEVANAMVDCCSDSDNHELLCERQKTSLCVSATKRIERKEKFEKNNVNDHRKRGPCDNVQENNVQST